MNYRPFFTSFLILIAVALPVLARENRVYSFGPPTGQRLIFTTPNTINSSAVRQLELLAARFSQNPPPVRVSIIITENDISVLPPDIRSGYPEGTNRVIALLTEEESGAVILLQGGDGNSVLIKNGSAGVTAPRWMLETMSKSLNRAGIAWNLEEKRMPLYRLGWIPDDPLLATYHRANIPALIVRTDADITGIFTDLTNSFKDGIPVIQDLHYLAERFHGVLFFISESMLVIIMIFASAIILLFLFVFSFLFGQKSDQHLRDFFHVWWLPFLYLVINIACLFAAQTLVTFLFKIRFGDAQAWTLLPRLAFLGKLILSWFFINLIISLNQLVRFPEDSFIYGYIASIVCMINIFVFSSLDFSLCLLFLSAYGISFVAYHFRHPAAQILGIICLALPFLPYIWALTRGNSDLLAPLYSLSPAWNVRLALFIMPFQLMISRLLHTAGNFGRKSRFYLPYNLIPIFVLAVICTGFLLFFPAWSVLSPLTVSIRQTIDSGGSHIATLAPVKLQNLKLNTDPVLAATPTLSPVPESFVHIQSSSRKFLERQLVGITIDPVIPVQKIEVRIVSSSGLSVYDASLPFELGNGGQESLFTSREPPDTPFVINFSSDIHSALTATVRVWTRTNPYGLFIGEDGITADYLLEIDRTVRLLLPVTAGEAR